MSRAINVTANTVDVLQACQKHKAAISDIENLASGGTRVVFLNADAAAIMTRVYAGKIIEGPVRRVPTRLARS